MSTSEPPKLAPDESTGAHTHVEREPQPVILGYDTVPSGDALSAHADIDWPEMAARYAPHLVMAPELSKGAPKLRVRGRATWEGDKIAGRTRYNAWDYHPRDVRLILRDGNAALSTRSIWGRFFSAIGALLRLNPMTRAPFDVAELLLGTDDDYLDVFPGTIQAARSSHWRKYRSLICNTTALDRYPPTAYVNIRHGDVNDDLAYRGITVVQYWLYFPYNDWKNTHEGDWEHVDVVFDGVTPLAVACSAHHGGARLDWDLAHRADDDGKLDSSGTHPVVYTASGSHANYLRGDRRHDTLERRPFLRALWRPMDHTFGHPDRECGRSGTIVKPTPVIVHPEHPEHAAEAEPLKFKGYWGSRGFAQGPFRLLPVVGSISRGPKSPPARDTWTNPFPWLEQCAEPSDIEWIEKARHNL